MRERHAGLSRLDRHRELVELADDGFRADPFLYHRHAQGNVDLPRTARRTEQHTALDAHLHGHHAALGGVMTMKVGVEGRVLLGPAGGPGQIDIPLRMAVVQEGVSPKTIVSKFYKFAVAIQPGQTSVPFAHVEQDLTFPMPRGADFDSYIVYVGFDPQSLNTKPERPAKKTKRK